MFTLVLTLSACFKVVDIPFATDPRILRGAWTVQMDATCNGGVNDAQVNSDNSRLVSSGRQSAIWNFATRAKIAPLQQNASESINQVLWGSDGQVIGTVFAGQSVLVRRWRANDGKTLSTSQMPIRVYSVLFSQDGSRNAFTAYDETRRRGTLKVFDATSSALSSISLCNEEYPFRFSDDGSGLFTLETMYTTSMEMETIKIRSSTSGAVLHSVDTSKPKIGNWAVRGSTIWGYSSGSNQLTRIDPSGVVTTQAFKINQGQAQGILGFNISPNARQLAVRSYVDARVYNLSDLSAPIKTIADTGLGSSLEWSADGTRLVLAFAEPRTLALNPYDSRLGFLGRFGVRCGLSARALSAAPDVDFIESEREQLAVSMRLEATYVSERSYAISGTATIGAQTLTVTGEGYAESDERLLTSQPFPFGQQIALTLRDSSGVTVWKNSYPQISLLKRDLGNSPINALGLLERVRVNFKMVDRFCQPFSSNTSRNKGVLHALATCASGDLWTTFVQDALATANRSWSTSSAAEFHGCLGLLQQVFGELFDQRLRQRDIAGRDENRVLPGERAHDIVARELVHHQGNPHRVPVLGFDHDDVLAPVHVAHEFLEAQTQFLGRVGS